MTWAPLSGIDLDYAREGNLVNIAAAIIGSIFVSSFLGRAAMKYGFGQTQLSAQKLNSLIWNEVSTKGKNETNP
jgi:hypothetical protein